MAVAGLTFLAAAFSAYAAFKTKAVALGAAESESYATRQAQLEQLRSRFEKRDYFLRFWRLTMATGESLINEFEGVKRTLAAFEQQPLQQGEIKYEIQCYNSQSPNALYLEPRVPRAHDNVRLAYDLNLYISNHISDHAAAQLVRDSLGPPWSSERADLLRLYYFARSVMSWIAAKQRLENDDARVRELTFVFGNELILTLSNHRLLASRMFFGQGDEASFEQYRVLYGLRDQQYARLVDLAAAEADRQGLLSPQHKRSIAITEQLLASTPVGNPMRRAPFPAPEWSVSEQSNNGIDTDKPRQ